MLCGYLPRVCWTEVQPTAGQVFVGRSLVRHTEDALRAELVII